MYIIKIFYRGYMSIFLHFTLKLKHFSQTKYLFFMFIRRYLLVNVYITAHKIWCTVHILYSLH